MAPTRESSRLSLGDLMPDQEVLTFSASDSVAFCISKLLINDFSQAPVNSHVDGYNKNLGYVHIARMALAALEGKAEAQVADFVEHAIIHSRSELISDVLAEINRQGFVFVGESGLVTGVLSASDVALKFEQIFLPFALFEVIETNLVRLVTQIKIRTDAEESAEKLTMGGMRRKIERPENWAKLQTNIDRNAFCDRLDWIVGKRNDLMHVRAKNLSRDDLIAIEAFAKLVEGIAR
jgi:hypothetical protein